MKNLQVSLKYFLCCVSFTGVFILSSCEKVNQKRTYEEVATPTIHDPQKLLQEMIDRGEDPHAFWKLSKNLSFPNASVGNPDEDFTGPPIPTIQSGFRPSETSVGTKTFGGDNSGSISPVSWSVPNGWKEKPSGGMRLASFTNEADPSLDVSIVSLSGEAGGVSANINRWLGQLRLPAFDDEALQQFLSKQEKFTSIGGLSITMVDFSTLLPKDDQSLPSMLAAIMQLSDQTVFVKMTGTVKEINKNRGLFRKLCRSLTILLIR